MEYCIFLVNFNDNENYVLWDVCPTWDANINDFSAPPEHSLGHINKKFFELIFDTNITNGGIFKLGLNINNTGTSISKLKLV